MKYKLIIFCILLLQNGVVLSQKERYISFELGGSGGLGSLNFEKDFFQKQNMQLSFRTGFSFAPIDKNNGTVLIFPQMIQAKWGKETHYMHWGIGLAPSITTRLAGAYVRIPLALGYTFEPADKNYFLRVAYTPLVSLLLDAQWQHWAGITFAYKLPSKKKSE